MRITFFLLLLNMMHVSASVLSQTVSLDLKNESIKSIFTKIEKQTGYSVVYNNRLIDKDKRITMKVENMPLASFLKTILDDKSLTFSLKDNTVLVKKNNLIEISPKIKKSSLSSSTKAEIIQRELTGTIRNQAGAVLKGVSIISPASSTMSDENGKFSIKVNSGSDRLTISMLGYVTQYVAVGDRNTIEITLVEGVSDLDEVVVVGFGERRKRDLTGSISTVGAEDIGRIQQASPQFALQGHTTGVRVTSVSGNPNEAPQIFVRGVGSWQSSSQPLYVVDGHIFEPPRASNEDVIGSTTLRTPPNIFNLINANDIESISVLKDASAAAVYGSRAANGVIIITTKRGKSERPIIEFDVNTSFQKMPTFEMLNTEQYKVIAQEMYTNSLNPDITLEKNLYGRNEATDNTKLTNFNPQFDPNSPYYISSNATYNWQNDLLDQNALNQNHSVRISGKAQSVDYYVSAGYYDQYGGINGNQLTRYTGAVNLNLNATSWAKVGVNYKYTSQNSINYSGDLQEIALAAPWQPIYNPNDLTGFERVIDPFLLSNTWQGLKKYGQGSKENYKATSTYATPNFDLNRNFGQFFLELTPFKGLKLRGSLNFDYTKQDRWVVDQYPIKNYFLPTGANPKTVQSTAPYSLGFVQHRINNSLNFQSDFTATYTRTFDDKHNVDVILGVQDQRHRREFISIEGKNITSIKEDIIRTGYDPDAANNDSFYGWNQRFWFGTVGRLSYHYDSKYYADISMRRDASNGFDKDYRWGNFYSFAGAWRISSEPFFNVDFINDLKLHGGWGEAGNDESAVGRYAFLSTVNTGVTTYRFGSGDGNPLGSLYLGGIINDFPNPTLSWEVARTTNIGFDAQLLNSKLNITAEWYKRITSGILQSVSLPFSVGTSNPLYNIGELKNTGVDLSAGYRDKVGDFSYGFAGNISFLNNVVTKLYNGQPLTINGLHRRHGDNVVRVEEGRSIGTIWGYKLGGIFQTQQEINDYYAATPDNLVSNINHVAPGDMYFLDVQGNPTEDEPFYSKTPDGRVNDNDRTEIGNVLPGYTYGLNFNFGYKGFDLVASFYGEGDVDKVNSTRRAMESMSGVTNQLATTLNRWTPTNTNTDMPRAVVGDPAGNNRISDRWVEDASFLRLNTWQLGYSLSQNTLNRLKNKISNARIFIGGHNNIYFHRWSTLDPVHDGFPLQRTINMGVSIKF